MIKLKRLSAFAFIFLILLSSFALSSCNADNNKHPSEPDIDKEELYNSSLTFIQEKNYEEAYYALVKIWDYKDAQNLLKRFTWKASAEKTIEGNQSYLHELGYDERGNVTKSAYLHSSSTTEYVYDEKDNLVSQRTDTVHSDGSSFTIITYEYNDNNLPVKKHYNDSSKNYFTYSYTYDENNALIKEVKSGISDSKTTYSYNEKGLLAKKSHYFNGRSEITEYTYDENGNLLEEKMTASNREDSHYVYTYDKNGNRLIEDKLKTNGLREITEYTYNEYNLKVQKKTYPYNLPQNVSICNYYYDENLRLTKQHNTTSRGYESDIEYSGYVLFYSEK